VSLERMTATYVCFAVQHGHFLVYVDLQSCTILTQSFRTLILAGEHLDQLSRGTQYRSA
jgi:hypothetical protein